MIKSCRDWAGGTGSVTPLPTMMPLRLMPRETFSKTVSHTSDYQGGNWTALRGPLSDRVQGFGWRYRVCHAVANHDALEVDMDRRRTLALGVIALGVSMKRLLLVAIQHRVCALRVAVACICVWSSGLRVWGWLGLAFRDWGLGIRVYRVRVLCCPASCSCWHPGSADCHPGYSARASARTTPRTTPLCSRFLFNFLFNCFLFNSGFAFSF